MSGNSNGDAASWPENALPCHTIVNGYRIERILGTGGFGIVYLARDQQGSIFALKEYFPRTFAARLGMTVLPALAVDAPMFDEWRERFRNEARVLFRLSSDGPVDGIVRARAFFEANGTCYLAMDHVPGPGLARILRQEPGGLASGRVQSLLFQLLTIVRIVHKAGQMHRDIKPDNIILREDGKVVLIDFGSSREVKKQHADEETRIFSPRHAPPEQMMSGLHQGTFSDIYAIGAVCYQAIGGSTVEAHERHNAVRAGKPDPQLSAEQVGSGRYPPSLLRVIDAALRIDAARRPENVDAMFAALDLEKVAEETTILAPRPAPPPRPGYRALIVASGALAFTGTAGLVLWLLAASSSTVVVSSTSPSAVASAPASAAAASPVAPLAVASPVAPLAMASAAVPVSIASSIPAAPLVVAPAPAPAAAPANPVSPSAVTPSVAASPFTASAPTFTAALGPAPLATLASPAVTLPLTPAIDGEQHWRWCIATGDPDRSIKSCTAVIEAGRGTLDRETRSRLTLAYTNLGIAHVANAKYERAIEDFGKAINLTPEFVDALTSRCWSLAVIRQLQMALVDCDKAVALASNDADARDSRGFTKLRLGLMKDAIADYDAALRIRPDMPEALYGRGLAYMAQKKQAQAERDIAAAKRRDPDIAEKFRKYGLVIP